MNRIPKSLEGQMSLEGGLLVASPRLTDAMFGRTVCLVVEHSAESGTAGVVLNRPVISDVTPLWQELTQGSHHTAEPPRHLHFGGPLSGPVVAVHDQESLADLGRGQGVYLAAQADTLKKLAFVAPQHYRLVVGHAAWKPGQLEREIAEGMWYWLPVDSALVFSADEEMWPRCLRRVGQMIVQHVTGVTHVPADPAWN